MSLGILLDSIMKARQIKQKPYNSMEQTDLSIKTTLDSKLRCQFKPLVKELKSFCHFDTRETMCVLFMHYKLCEGKPFMGRKLFHDVLYNMFNIQSEEMAERINGAVEEAKSPGITPDIWVKLMSLFLRGTLDEKIFFCFNVYDNMGIGYITKNEMTKLLKLTFIAKKQDAVDHASDFSDMLMRKFDQDRDGKISFQDYSDTVRMNNDLLQAFGKCLPDRLQCYAVMTMFTTFVSTMHHNYIDERFTTSEYELNVYQKGKFIQ